MKRARTESTFDDSIHHMEMACIMNDAFYLKNEIVIFLKNYDPKKLDNNQQDQLRKVSLNAAMDGNTKCLECLDNMNIPLDVMCPVIAAYHGHKNVIDFCALKGMDCTEAWNRYFGWMLMANHEDSSNDAKESVDLTLASEWLSNYNRVQNTIEIKN